MFKAIIDSKSHEDGLLASFTGSSPALGSIIVTVEDGTYIGKIDAVLGNTDNPIAHIAHLDRKMNIDLFLGCEAQIRPKAQRQDSREQWGRDSDRRDRNSNRDGRERRHNNNQNRSDWRDNRRDSNRRDSDRGGSRGRDFNRRDSDRGGSRGRDFNRRDSDRGGSRGRDFNRRDSDRGGSRGRDFNRRDSDRGGSRGRDFNRRDSDRGGSRGRDFNRRDSDRGGSRGRDSRNNRFDDRQKKVYADNDWTCKKCNNVNFSFRKECNRCGEPKDGQSGGRRNNDRGNQQRDSRQRKSDDAPRKFRKARGKSANHAHNRGPKPLNARPRRKNRDD